MSISKKIRFEVFKRDVFRCGYCGKHPPEVILEVDHIIPKSKKGKDDINNLMTACFDCNRGKKNIPLDKIPPKIIDNIEILKEQELQIKEYRKIIAKISKRLDADIETINAIYKDHYIGFMLNPNFQRISVRKFLQLLPLHQVTEAMYIAINKFRNNTAYNREAVNKYFCGICWGMIREKQCLEEC